MSFFFQLSAGHPQVAPPGGPGAAAAAALLLRAAGRRQLQRCPVGTAPLALGAGAAAADGHGPGRDGWSRASLGRG